MKLCKIAGAGQGASIDDELVMIHAETGRFFALKDTGLRIWELLDSEPDLNRIGDELARQYDIDDETCRSQVRSFADQLVEAGFARYC
jgi:hypothetical protein